MKLTGVKGYTILEVMIFLAITGLLFVSAIVAVGGNQQRVQYSQTVRDFEVQIKDVINDVSDGFYPAFTEGSCTKTIGSPQIVNLIPGGVGTPGTNSDCINIGKVLMFNLDNETDNIGVGTIVAVNPGVGEEISTGFENMSPTLAFTTDGVDLTTTKPIRYGSVVTKIGDKTNSANQYSSLSIISNFNTDLGNANKNGVLVSSIYGKILPAGSLVRPPSPAKTKSDFKTEVQRLSFATTDYAVNREFYICLLTTEGKIARIIVGVGGVPTATATEYDLLDDGDCPSE